MARPRIVGLLHQTDLYYLHYCTNRRVLASLYNTMGKRRDASAALAVENNEKKYSIRVSLRFLVLSFLASCLAAFATGHTARIFLIQPQQESLKLYKEQLAMLGIAESATTESADNVMLPDPVLQAGKTPPITTYTSKNFNTAKTTTSHSRFMEASEVADDQIVEEEQCRSSTNATIVTSEEDEEEHLPAGQHLLIDIEHVDSAFLNSEERLATAMLDLVNVCGLTLLSYHCHGLQPSGVSCAGVLLESHVSFHTWPAEGVITLDLFTCGPNSLLPIVPLAERLFAVQSVEKIEEPKVIWAHKYRGFGREFDHEITDMFHFPVGNMNDFKQQVWNGLRGIVELERCPLCLCSIVVVLTHFLFPQKIFRPFR